MEKRRDIRNFYVDEAFIPTYQKFKQIAETEHKSVSDKIRELLTEYVRLHEPGNPQQRIDTIISVGKAYHADQCFNCGRKPTRQGIKKGIALLFCEDCFEKEKVRLNGWKPL